MNVKSWVEAWPTVAEFAPGRTRRSATQRQGNIGIAKLICAAFVPAMVSDRRQPVRELALGKANIQNAELLAGDTSYRAGQTHQVDALGAPWPLARTLRMADFRTSPGAGPEFRRRFQAVRSRQGIDVRRGRGLLPSAVRMGKLPFARHCSRQQQTRNVHARNQQNQAHCTQEEPERGFDALD